MPVRMELSRIILSEINSEQVIYLKEVDGDRMFPIVIGIFEATSIDRKVKGHEMPRPLTHSLIVNLVEQLGADNITGLSAVPKLRNRRKAIGRRAFLTGRRQTVRTVGLLGSDSASISSEKPGENPGRRKSKVS